YFHQYFAEFKSVFLENLNQPYISELNITLISWVCDKLEIPWQNVKASLLASKKGTATEKLISICKEVHGTEYLSGGGGRKYLKEDLFTDYQLTLTYSGYVNANHLTILDALFHIGPDKILDDFKKNIVNVGKIKDGT
ncbi:MAG: WbqC family protein, partial [Saprospiraceae bacterium]|nr:WbqC family protein [Saprospiraceae bacterium]